MEPDEYLLFYRIHALGHYLMMQAAAEHMKQAMFGRIVNVTSVTGVTAAYSSPAYTSNKAAAICQTKSFAKKIREIQHHRKLNRTGHGQYAYEGKLPSEEFAAVAENEPAGARSQNRLTWRAWLCFSREHLFVSGQNIIVDGGATV